MKKITPIAITLILLSSLTIDASAAVKAGTACKKLGQTSTSAGKKFTCIKTGNKLVWNKGIVLSHLTPKPSPSPSTPSSANESQSSTSIENPTQVTSISIPDLPTSFSNLEKNFEGIPYASWKNIQQNLSNHPSSSLKISFLFGPNTPKRYPDQWTIDAVTLGSRVMGAQKQPAEILFVQYNKVDVQWARTQAEKFSSPFNLGINFADQAAEKCSGIDCDGAVTNMTTDIGLVLVGVATPITRYNIQKFNGQNDLHEYTHAVQGMIYRGKTKTPPTVMTPCWFAEGQPQAISIPSVTKSADEYVKIRNGWIKDNQWQLKDYEPESIQQFLKDNMKVPCPGSTYAMLFSLGYIVMDALVAVGGVDKTFDVLSAIADGMSFEDAFKKVYGIEWNDASIILANVASRIYKTALNK
jgi:hypothetical protein